MNCIRAYYQRSSFKQTNKQKNQLTLDCSFSSNRCPFAVPMCAASGTIYLQAPVPKPGHILMVGPPHTQNRLPPKRGDIRVSQNVLGAQ